MRERRDTVASSSSLAQKLRGVLDERIGSEKKRRDDQRDAFMAAEFVRSFVRSFDEQK